MAQSGSLSDTLKDTVTLSRELREEGQIDGQVKLYNVDAMTSSSQTRNSSSSEP